MFSNRFLHLNLHSLMIDVLILCLNSRGFIFNTCQEKCVSFELGLCTLFKLYNLILCFCKAQDFLSFQFGLDSFGNFFEFMNTSNYHHFVNIFYQGINKIFGVMAHILKILFFHRTLKVNRMISFHECHFFAKQVHFICIRPQTFSIEQ